MKKRAPPPWLMPAIQWFALAAMAGLAVTNAVTDHGIEMAINCFFLGFLFCTMVLGKLMDRRVARIDALFADLKSAEAVTKAAAAKFEQAINDGFIEVIPMIPDNERPPTRH